MGAKVKFLNLKNCHVLESSNTIFFDVDETLICWDHFTELHNRKISIKDPYMDGHIVKCIPHLTHINIMKRNKEQGRTVIVWSAGGHKWAQAVVEALKLEKYVSLIMDKPSLIVDDISMDDWHPKRIYIQKDIEGELSDKESSVD